VQLGVRRALRHETHRTAVDGADDVAGAVAGRHHHHRHRRVGGAEFDQHVEAVSVAQGQIEQHQVEVAVGGEPGARCGSTGGPDDRGAATDGLDHGFERRKDQRMVIDQQHLHVVLLPATRHVVAALCAAVLAASVPPSGGDCTGMHALR